MNKEIAMLFVGMTCRFEGVPFEFEVAQTYAPNEPHTEIVVHPLVETVDGSLHPDVECQKVFTGYSVNSYCDFDWYSQDQLDYATENGDVIYCEEDECYAVSNKVVYCDHSETYEHMSSCTRFDGNWYLDSSDLLRTSGDGVTFLEGDDDYVYCDRAGDYYHIDDCHYCPSEGLHVYGSDDSCSDCCPQTEIVHPYHRSGIHPDIRSGSSGWCVGFEVEKTSVLSASEEGDSIEDRPLFAYWETDASCGIEGITHAYDPLDTNRIKEFKRDVSYSSEYLSAPCDESCGGHINISSSSHSPRALLNEFRVFAPLWFAVYRHRLNSNYCNQDKKIEHGREKYSPVITKPFGIEIRLPSRVRNANQLLGRFEWVGVTCQSISEGATFNRYVKDCRSVLFDNLYSGDRTKYARVLRIARKFRVWMLDGVADQEIHQWI